MKVELTTHQASNLRRMLGQALGTYQIGGSISGALNKDGISVTWAFTEENTEPPLGDWKERWKKGVTEKCVTLEISQDGAQAE